MRKIKIQCALGPKSEKCLTKADIIDDGKRK